MHMCWLGPIWRSEWHVTDTYFQHLFGYWQKGKKYVYGSYSNFTYSLWYCLKQHIYRAWKSPNPLHFSIQEEVGEWNISNLIWAQGTAFWDNSWLFSSYGGLLTRNHLEILKVSIFDMHIKLKVLIIDIQCYKLDFKGRLSEKMAMTKLYK